MYSLYLFVAMFCPPLLHCMHFKRIIKRNTNYKKNCIDMGMISNGWVQKKGHFIKLSKNRELSIHALEVNSP